MINSLKKPDKPLLTLLTLHFHHRCKGARTYCQSTLISLFTFYRTTEWALSIELPRRHSQVTPTAPPAFVDAPGFTERENAPLNPTTLKQGFGYTHSYNPCFHISTAVRWPFCSLTNTITPVDCLFRVILWGWSVWKKEVIKWDNRYALMAPLSYRKSRVHYILSMNFLLSCTCYCRAHFLPLGKCRVNGKGTWAEGRII